MHMYGALMLTMVYRMAMGFGISMSGDLRYNIHNHMTVFLVISLHDP